MGLSSQDLDAIFNGTGAVINTAQNITSAIAGGVNDIQNIMDNSRRNATMPQPQMSYQQPVTYGYPYADNGYNYNGFSGYNNYQQGQMNVGYPGFTNPNYGALIGGNYTPSNPFDSPKGGNWY